MSEQERSAGKRQCFLSVCALVLSLLLLGAAGMNSGLRKKDEGIFLLNICRTAVAGFAEKTDSCFRKDFRKLADEDPEFMLRITCTDLR